MTEPLLKGRFTVYETSEGGYHIAYINDGQDDTKHLEVPAWAVNIARDASEGKLSPMSLVGRLMSIGH